jgi:glycosyltransferase involved in cell wall biosynthesis
MRCPTVSELPPPPTGRTGWPWTEGSAVLPATRPDGTAWPLLSVITPSFEQARFLEATIRSILLQGYPNLEYFVLDAASADGSVDIIKRYAPWLAFWVSERDAGQSSAINRGLNLASGLFTTWINSDDLLHQNALFEFASAGRFDPNTLYVGDCLYIDEHDNPLKLHRGRVHNFEDLVSVRTVWRGLERGHIVQPEVLFPRQLALDVGSLDVQNHRTMDFELWGRFLLAGARFEYTHRPFGVFRLHAAQKTGQNWAQTESLVATAVKLVERADSLPEITRTRLVEDLRAYQRDYWRSTGPLARVGLSPDIVLPLRHFQAGLRKHAGDLARWRSRRNVR